MKSPSRFGLSILLLALVSTQPASGYSYPLSSEAIREAYFLGKGDAERRAEFFGRYTQQFPRPKAGVHVALIQFETPYVVIAERVSQNVSNYSAPDAEQEFLGKRIICRVRVQVFFGDRHASSFRMDSFPGDYAIRLTQGDEEISSQASRREPLYLSGPRYSTVIGTEMDLEYDTEKIDSAAPATVEVMTPDGQDVQATFDLSKLR